MNKTGFGSKYEVEGGGMEPATPKQKAPVAPEPAETVETPETPETHEG